MLKSFSSRELIKILKADGWYLVHSVGSHHQYKHPTKVGKVTIPHPKGDITIKTVQCIARQAEIIIK
ncbi:type II toxin-antitoxin system HicA family toxin [Kurthia gibsonii]|uniref:type II toxin-antitoxin system HicA family toxin n=1 Tax=Kurthia gibsonii TaxID=33946 RepID=UPI002DB73953|nr:type II toxin-antitoxin system HicA family toxin [Kurthia gibsonii]